MKTKSKAFIGVVSAFVVLCIALLAILPRINANAPEKEVILMSASWAYNHRDVTEMAEMADVIALVKITGLHSVQEKNYGASSEFKAEVLQPILGDVGNEILLFQTGGELDEVIFMLDDDPLFQKGEEYLIFGTQNADGTVSPISGPQGRLYYENGVLNSMNALDSTVARANAANNIMVQNRTLEDVLAEVENALGQS